MRFISAAIAAIVLMTTMIIGAAPASAGVVCDRTGVCGDVYYRSGPPTTLKTTCAFANPNSSVVYIKKGQWSTCKDVDGFFIPAGCTDQDSLLVGPKWRKVADTTNARVDLRCR